MSATQESDRNVATSESAGTSWRDWFGPGIVVALGSLVSIAIPFPGSDSGSLGVYPAEGMLVIIGGVLLAMLVSRRWRPSSSARRLILVVVAFLAWYLVVSVVRQLAGEEVKQSALALRTTILPLVCYALLDIGWEKPLRVVRGVAVLELGISLVHLPAWQNMRMSDYLGNSIVYAGFLVMLIPVNTYILATRGKGLPDRILKTVAAANLFFGVVMPVLTGSRSLTMIAALTAALSALIMVRGVRAWALLGLVAVCAGATFSALWATNPGDAAYGIYRLVPPPATRGDATVLEVIGAEKVKADSNRTDLRDQSIKEIENDPIFTDGRLYFPFKNDFGEKEASAHNFVLEHINAYGVIGFVLYLAMFGVVLAPGWRRLRMRELGAAENVCAWLTLGATMGFSLVQPTLLILTIAVPMWLTISAMKQRQANFSANPDRTIA